ncbi:MAG: polysaccharide biosynthesis/export family protein [Clostridia bacterium]|nr:polysaccharide biosynthesis/export family protein [Deltaproteobacteria bacterium]
MIRKLSVLFLVVLSDCGPKTYVWAKDLPDSRQQPETYAIRQGDRLAILVWNQPQLSGNVRVRSDGVATVPLIGDLAVAGLTAPDASAQIKRRLSGLVVDPNVTVTVDEAQAVVVSVVGEVRNPGAFATTRGETVLHLIARAGGLTEYASPSSIYVVRRDLQTPRVRFKFKELAAGDVRSMGFGLRDGDVIVVE